MMQRDRLICCLVGKYSALYPKDTAKDLQIMVDQHLINCNLPPMGSEKGDTELLDELINETIWSALSAGTNRATRRKKGFSK